MSRAPASGAPGVMIVDDDALTVRLVATALRQAGIRSVIFNGSPDAVTRAIADADIDVVLVGVTSDSNDSLVLFERVRQVFDSQRVRLVAMGTRSDTHTIARHEQVGGNDYLRKPINLDVCLTRVRSQLRRTGRRSGEVKAHGADIAASHVCPRCWTLADHHAERCETCGAKRPREGWRPREHAPHPHLGTVLQGRFLVDRFMGGPPETGVYRAQDLEQGQQLNVRFVRSRQTSSARSHFDEVRREMMGAAGSEVAGPHILRVHDIFQLSARTSAVLTEFVEGETLEDRIQRDGPLRAKEALRLVEQLAHGLLDVHERGFIHRNLTPSNILLTSEKRFQAKIKDFGLAIWIGSEFDSAAEFGTPEYASPEQLLGDPVDHRADIYGVGAVLYYAVTGRAPVSAGNMLSLIHRRTAAPPPRPSERHLLPSPRMRRIDGIVAQAMAAQPNDRYVNARALLSAVK